SGAACPGAARGSRGSRPPGVHKGAACGHGNGRCRYEAVVGAGVLSSAGSGGKGSCQTKKITNSVRGTTVAAGVSGSCPGGVVLGPLPVGTAYSAPGNLFILLPVAG